MRCARCGKMVSVFGSDCSNCGADKSELQSLWMLGVGCFSCGVVVGLNFGGMRGLLLGALLGGAVLVITQILVNRVDSEWRPGGNVRGHARKK